VRRAPVSSLTSRILAINVLALAILLGGLLYLDQYRDGLVEAKLAALTNQAEIIAAALGERAVTGDADDPALDPELARQMIGRLVVPIHTRARVFDAGGALLGDSRELLSAGREVQTAVLPPPGSEPNPMLGAVARIYDWIVERLPRDKGLPLYTEAPDPNVEDYREAAEALQGQTGRALRSRGNGRLVLSAAVPIQQFKKVLGALMLSAGDDDIRHSVRVGRFAIIKVFLLALAITVLLSLFLAGTIARPVRRLAAAARRVRHGQGRRVSIPDFTNRRDEIGELSGALSDMTETLYRRLDAIESFAADVAHEIRNPLTSLQSAVDTLPRTKSEAQRERLLEIIRDDVNRLDRLISDISDASRLDAELSRAVAAPVDLSALLTATVEVYRTTKGRDAPDLELEADQAHPLTVEGIEDRLGQVVDNLLANAISFSPPDGVIRFRLAREGEEVVFSVEDQGPGIPDKNLEAVFERFYTLRPEGEAFGTHSGLGLSIARQIVEAHGGTIEAANLRHPSGRVRGLSFTVRLPA
jgi:two-component system sensor histidine kinase ChvG